LCVIFLTVVNHAHYIHGLYIHYSYRDLNDLCKYTECSRKKTAQSLMHRHFVTVCSRITRFSPKCSEMN